jgi:LmbE family N-acetylglucosaminyl deacetylase
VAGYDSLPRGDVSSGETRVIEARKAMDVVGARNFEILQVGDGQTDCHLRLDTVPQIELVSFIEHYLKTFRPSIVIMPCRGHYHQDHRALADAAVAALRPAPDSRLPFVPVVLAYGHAAAGWGDPLNNFNPNFFVDISTVIDMKIKALACYESQLCQPPHPRSLEAVRANAAAWGAFAGSHYAEPYQCVRHVLR